MPILIDERGNVMPIGFGPGSTNVLKAAGRNLTDSENQIDPTVGRMGLPVPNFRPGSAEFARLPMSPGIMGRGRVRQAPMGEGTIQRMLLSPTPAAMAPLSVGGQEAYPGTPPPAIMAQQVAPAGPQVKPVPPSPSTAIGGAGIAPTAATPVAAPAPAPAGQPSAAVGGGSKAAATAPSAAPSAAAGAPSPWWSGMHTGLEGQTISPGSVAIDRPELYPGAPGYGPLAQANIDPLTGMPIKGNWWDVNYDPGSGKGTSGGPSSDISGKVGDISGMTPEQEKSTLGPAW